MRLCALISMVCVLTAFGSARSEPGFDPQQVVREARAFGEMTGETPGNLGRVRHPETIEGRRRSLGADERFGGGPEFLIDTNSVLIPAPGLQNEPAIAFDGVNFLVVWEDHRIGSSSGIRAARVTPTGTVLDPSGFLVSQGTNDRSNPFVGFDGENFLVVWEDYRGIWDSDIYAARVTRAGSVLDPAGFAVAQVMNSDQSSPVLDFDGENFLVAWQDCRDNRDEPDIYGARVTSAGTVLDTSGFVITQAANGQYGPAIGFGGKNFLVVWQDRRDTLFSHIYGNLVTPEGQVIVPNDFVISYSQSSQGAATMGFDGENFLVAWQDIYGSFPPSLSIRGSRVTPGGGVLDPDAIVISPTAGVRTAVGSDVDYFVVWQDGRVGASLTDVYGTRVTPDGEVTDPEGFVIPRAARDQFTPALASGGANLLVVWEDRRGGVYPDIYGARVTPTGTVLDPDGLAISAAANSQHSPAIGFDGANFLVVWTDDRSGQYSSIYGARVTPQGVVLDTDGFAIAQAVSRQRSPAVGFDGANFLVVWEDNRSGEYKSDIYGARVTSAGTVLDPAGIAVSQAAGGQYSPALGFDGANFLAVWTDNRNGEYSDIYGARVTRQGAVLDPQGLAVSTTARDQLSPVLGFDGANFLVAWTDYRSGIYSDIFGARVTSAGTVLDPAGISIARAAKGQSGPAVGLGFNGEDFLVVWEDYRSNCPDIYGALVSPDGVASDTGVIVRQEGNQFFPVLALGPDSLLFLVYQGWAGTVGGKTYNTDRIWGKTNPVPGAVEDGSTPQVAGRKPIAGIVRGVLFLPEREGPSPSCGLLDISGRKVMDLEPGANDVRALAPGVYFVRDAGDRGRTQKVILQR